MTRSACLATEESSGAASGYHRHALFLSGNDDKTIATLEAAERHGQPACERSMM